MKRPRVLTVLMWFCAIYAIGAAFGIGAAIVHLGRYIGGYSIGGMPVSRAQWLTIAGPLVATIAVFMAATALALKRHYRWARTTFMCIWPIIIAYGIGCAILGAIPWTLALRALVDATFAGAITGWLLFLYKPDRAFFERPQPNEASEEL
ncbi:MAG: hypothetical protein DLM73_00260 [Chthoniobacterales bacterium]|nr:MAG: hypothetical protein DLM73_00260 [Chthoniobacterales bacterium]